MEPETFVDTSGFYALLVKRDDCHVAARDYLRLAASRRERFVTTDYVLDETATLLKARGYTYLLEPFFSSVLDSKACRVEWISARRFADTVAFFLKYRDHGWSFTDSQSFRVMKELRLQQALTKDAHFAEAGFIPLLRS